MCVFRQSRPTEMKSQQVWHQASEGLIYEETEHRLLPHSTSTPTASHWHQWIHKSLEEVKSQRQEEIIYRLRETYYLKICNVRHVIVLWLLTTITKLIKTLLKYYWQPEQPFSFQFHESHLSELNGSCRL